MSRASGSERASRSSLVPTSVSPAPGGERFTQAGSVAMGPRAAVVDVDGLGGQLERRQRVGLRGEVVHVGRDAAWPISRSDTPGSVSRKPDGHRAFHRAGLTGYLSAAATLSAAGDERVPICRSAYGAARAQVRPPPSGFRSQAERKRQGGSAPAKSL